ncbi:MAG: zinc ribbon domain-containing protein [Clostridia bacterium]|nr:zinc ribbon domain-containing protein [Clostridia bacterium]
MKNGDGIKIRITRDSVSMGDDCMAPHESEMLFGAADTWVDLLNAAANYLPPMHDCKWEVMCDAEVLGTLTSGSGAAYQVEVKHTDALISDLPERDIFCRKIEKIKNLTYFERLEVLYGGVYFSLNCFGEYGNVRLILEKEETKITTRDKTFASKHGFKHRELGNYDKILPIDQFEGLRILRIPNDPHTETVYIDISKEKISDELKKRVKSPHDMITDGVLSYGVNVGRLVFEEEGFTVYTISDFPHIGSSDVLTVYQISKEDYEKLLPLSCPDSIPQPPVSSTVTDVCRKKFLCGESEYCERYYCALDDADILLAERIHIQSVSENVRQKVMNYCPVCGKKNDGGKFCTECGAKLLKE